MANNKETKDKKLGAADIKSTDIKLSDQQFRILELLAELGEGLRARGSGKIARRPRAHHGWHNVDPAGKKGVLASDLRGRERVFRPLLSTADVQRSTVSGLISTMFGGSSSALLAHLLREEEIADGDLAEIKKMLDEGT